MLALLLLLLWPIRGARADEIPPPRRSPDAQTRVEGELSAEDRELLEQLDLLLDFELLEAWDPDVDEIDFPDVLSPPEGSS